MARRRTNQKTDQVSPPLWQERLVAITLAVGLHALIAALLWLNMSFSHSRPARTYSPVIEAVIVDADTLKGPRVAPEPQVVERPEPEPEPEPEPVQPEPEQQPPPQPDAALQARKEAARRLLAEQEKQLEEIRRRREQAEQESIAEQQRLDQMDQQQQRDEQARQQRLDAQRRQQLLALEQSEQTASRQASLRDQYLSSIQRTVTNSWLRPPTARPGLECALRLHQIPGGEVIEVSIASPCNADPNTRRSIEAAVKRASPLPYKGFEDVFARELSFIFVFNG